MAVIGRAHRLAGDAAVGAAASPHPGVGAWAITVALLVLACWVLWRYRHPLRLAVTFAFALLWFPVRVLAAILGSSVKGHAYDPRPTLDTPDVRQPPIWILTRRKP